MKLVELQPRWIERDGQRVALIFLCPHCVGEGRPHPYWTSCFFVPQRKFRIAGTDEYEGQYDVLAAEMKALGLDEDKAIVIGCKDGIAWTKTSDDFATISITPSLDASNSGHWHGFVTNGEAL